MLSGRSHRRPSPQSQEASPSSERLLALPAAPAAQTIPLRVTGRSSRGDAHENRRRWLRFALRVLILPALLFVVLVPPQSLRATLVTLLIIAALGIVVWRLPMADEE